MAWETPKNNWLPTQEAVGNGDFNRIENNTLLLSDHNLVFDYEGNGYRTIQIGSQLWTIDSFRGTKNRDGSAIANETDDTLWSALTTPAYCKYDNVNEWGGYLYNWHVVDPANTVEVTDIDGNPETVQAIAPEGWRVPTEADYLVLMEFLAAGGYNWDNTYSPGVYTKISKSLASALRWGDEATAGYVGNDRLDNNITNFSALPVGGRGASGLFSGKTVRFQAWTTTPGVAGESKIFGVFRFDSGVTIGDEPYAYGNSVRFVKDIV